MHDLILHLGSNLGWRNQQLQHARHLLDARLGTEVNASFCYETSAWGVENQAPFLNQAVHYQSLLTPLDALETVLNIETEMGRRRQKKWGSRLIDIDLIFYDDVVLNHKKLTLPHPWLQERRFVLVPLADIIPDWEHPVLKKNINELLKTCTDQGTARRVNGCFKSGLVI